MLNKMPLTKSVVFKSCSMINALAQNIGEGIVGWVKLQLQFLTFLRQVVVEFMIFYREKQVSYLVLLRQVLFTGYQALSLIVLIAIAIGGLIILEGYTLLENFGQSDLLYGILVAVITRELSSLITAFIIIARSGNAIATELGNMRVNMEIDALKTIGLSPISYLVVPRTIGVVVSLLVLNVYFNVSGLFGGWLVSSWFYPIDFNVFFSKLLAKLTLTDIVISVVKSLLFGFFIAVIASYQGLNVRYATTEVPQRTILAVVQSITVVILINIGIALLFYT